MEVTNIKILWNELFDTYTVYANDKEILTNVSQDEVERITIREIIDLSTANE